MTELLVYKQDALVGLHMQNYTFVCSGYNCVTLVNIPTDTDRESF